MASREHSDGPPIEFLSFTAQWDSYRRSWMFYGSFGAPGRIEVERTGLYEGLTTGELVDVIDAELVTRLGIPSD